ncbi:MAG: hypothetical protein V3T17_13935 [Pseudomonadales bacterium]
MIAPRLAFLLSLPILLLACESDNEHFCARYQYVYEQLLVDDVPPYDEMKLTLVDNLSNPKKDKGQAKFMLFVLEDWYSGFKPEHEPAQDFCMRIKRWQHYQ